MQHNMPQKSSRAGFVRHVASVYVQQRSVCVNAAIEINPCSITTSPRQHTVPYAVLTEWDLSGIADTDMNSYWWWNAACVQAPVSVWYKWENTAELSDCCIPSSSWPCSDGSWMTVAQIWLYQHSNNPTVGHSVVSCMHMSADGHCVLTRHTSVDCGWLTVPNFQQWTFVWLHLILTCVNCNQYCYC